jgi:hypothetical protein
MPSTRNVEPLDELAVELLAMTPEENEALWRVREQDYLPPAQYLAWCSLLTKNVVSSHDDLATVEHVPFEI